MAVAASVSGDGEDVVVVVVVDVDVDVPVSVWVVVVVLVFVVVVVSLSANVEFAIIGAIVVDVVVVVCDGGDIVDRDFGTDNAIEIEGQGSVPVKELIADNMNQNTNHKWNSTRTSMYRLILSLRYWRSANFT